MIMYIIILFLFFILPLLLLMFFALKSWKKGNKKTSLLFFFIFLIFMSPFICDIGCNMCDLEKEDAYNEVVEYIQEQKLDVNKIQFINNSGSCIYVFEYKNKNKKIYFRVLSTWLQGVKITFHEDSK